MKTKTKSSIRNNSLIFILVLAGILVFVNIISVKLFMRADLTENRLFTLSKASVTLMKSLEDKFVVKAYFTKNLPGRYATLERQVRDLLEEYAQYSKGHMSIEFIDPSSGSEEEAKEKEKIAQSLGIAKMPNPDIEKDKAVVKEGYRGISFSYRDKQETVRAVETSVGLEYEITSILKKFLSDKNTIAFSTGNGEPAIEPPQDPRRNPMDQQGDQGAFLTVRKNLDVYEYKQYDSKKEENGVPENVKGMVIIGANTKFSDLELYNLDQFLMKGGALAVFVDGVTVVSQEGQMRGMPTMYNSTANDTNLRDLLKHYGIEVGSELIMDANASQFIAKCSQFPIAIPKLYPAWPLITSFGEDHPLTFGLGALTMPYATEVKLTKDSKSSASLQAREIAFTSGNAWRVSAGGDVDPCTIKPSDSWESSIPVAAALSGNFTSYFKGRDLPKKGEATVEGFVEQSKAPGRIVVVGSSGLPSDEKLQIISRLDRRAVAFNFSFVQNALDWMTNDDDLIAVRMKNVDDPPVERKMSDGAKSFAKWGNIIGIPALFLLFGVIRWRIRKAPASDESQTAKASESTEKNDNTKAGKEA